MEHDPMENERGNEVRFETLEVMRRFVARLLRDRQELADVLDDVNIPCMFDEERIRMCDTAVFADSSDGKVASFSIARIENTPAIHAYFTLPEMRGKQYADRILKAVIERIREKHGDVPVYFDAISDESTKHRDKLVKELNVRFWS
jgi:GNAT superfamily N-acetyltransferase